MKRTVAVICLAVAPLVAMATIYKVRMPDGTILFTDSPPAGAKILEERQPLPAPPRQPATGTATPRASDKATPAPANPAAAPSATQAIEAAMVEISEAERELASAKRRLETGREPLPGERLGTVSGRSRLSPEYHNRIAALEREVAAADARVKRAYEARNALR
ncbi:MAG: hypothetical protein ACM3O5_12615 [Betaproteobacteria bacterium]